MASELLAPTSQGSLSDLSSRFDAVAARIRRVALLRGLGRLALFTAILCGAGFLADWLWPLPGGIRLGWLLLIVAVAAYLVWTEIFRPVFRQFTVAELAAVVEDRYPDLGERLTSAVELTDPSIPEDQKGSALMREWLEAETISSTRHIDFRKAVSSDRAQKSAWIGGIAGLLLLAPFLAMPSGYGLLWARLILPWASHEVPAVLYFQVPEGDRVVARGEDLTLIALPPADLPVEDLPADVELVWTGVSGQSDRRPMEYDAEKAGYVVTVPHVFEDFEYIVTAPRKRSDRHRITVVDRPEIVTFTLTITPPSYTGLEDRTVDGAVGEVMAFERSRIKAELEFNKPLARAQWLWQDSEGSAQPTALPFQLSEDGKSATLDLVAASGSFAARVRDEHGLSNLEEPARNLILIADQPPELTVTGQTDTTSARGDDVVTLEALAEDDLKISALELHIETSDGRTAMKPAPAEALGQSEARQTFKLDLSEFELADGDWLKYRFRAADNRPIPGPNEVWSSEQRIIIDPQADLPGSEEVAKRQNELRDILEQIRADLGKNRAETEKLLAEAEKKQADGEPFEKQAELDRLEKQQQDLSARLEELAVRFGGHRLFSNLTPETQRIAREPLKKSAEQLQKVHEQDQAAQEPLQKSVQALAEADADLEKLAKRFDELAELERDLLVVPRLAQQAERVADQALELSKRRENPPAEETPEQKAAREEALGREEAVVEEERQKLTEALDDLLKHRPEILEAARKTALEEIAELSKQAAHLAERQEALTEGLKADAEQAAKAAEPIADRQAELVKKAEALKPDPKTQNPENAKPPVTPLDPDELRKVLEDLKAGNLDEAADQQEALADRLEALAAELKKNQELPSDPQKAAEQLATRQRELQQQIAEAAKTPPGQNASAEEKQAFENTLRKLAEQQTGIQAGISQIESPARNRKQHQQALDESAETVQNLVQHDAEQAADKAKDAAETLEQLAKDIGTPEERLAKAEAEKQQAQETLQKSKEAQDRQEELIKKQKEQDPNRPADPKTEKDLQRLKQAQKQAEEELERLQKELAKEEKPEQPKPAPENDLPKPEDVEKLAQEARAVAEEIDRLKQERAALDPERAALDPEPAAKAEQPEPKPAGESAQAAESQPNNQPPNPQRPNDPAANNPPENPQDPSAPRPNDSDPNPSRAEDSKMNPSDPNDSRPEQSPAPGETSKTDPNPPAPENAAKGEEPKPSDNQAPGEAKPTAGENPSTENDSRPNPQRAEQSSEAQPAGQDLAQRQAELARNAADLAIQVAQDQGVDSPASEAAMESARKAGSAREQTEDGALDRAAETAQQAAQSAKTAAEELGKSDSAELAREADRQAKDQAELAKAIAEAAADPARRRAAQQAGQQGLEKSTGKLASDLSEAAEKLASTPLDLEQPAEKTETAGQAAAEADQEMKQSQANASKGNAARAASAGEKAAEALSRAAGQSPAPPADTPENTLVPGDLADQVAEARRRLEEAKKQLQNAGQVPESPQTANAGNEGPMNEPGEDQKPMPGENNQDGQVGENTGQPGQQNQPGQQGQPGQQAQAGQQQQPGQGQQGQQGQARQSARAQSAQSLQQAAQALSQAAQQLMPGGAPGQSRGTSQASNPSNRPGGQPSESGSEGPGSQSPIPIEQLEAVLKSQGSEEWGRLPGQLRTEILQGNQQKTEGDYARLIKLYSEELLKKQQTQPDKD